MDEQISQDIKKFLDGNLRFFEGWFNATISQDELSNFSNFLHENWRLVNKNTPRVVNDKDTFINVWPSFYGRFKETPIQQENEYLVMDQIAENTYLVVVNEITRKPDETSQRPVSVVLKRKGQKDFQVYHVHE